MAKRTHIRSAPLAPPPRLQDDPYLAGYSSQLDQRRGHIEWRRHELCSSTAGSLPEVACGHEYYGLHRTTNGWVFREWAPNATTGFLIGTFSNWECLEHYRLQPLDGGNGDWELHLPPEALHHGDLYRLHFGWKGGGGDRIPAYARRIVQDPESLIFNAQVWQPDSPYHWRHDENRSIENAPPLIYEAHVGMAQEHEGVGSYLQFTEQILPRIQAAGYNTVQLMALMEHPYYGSFGYHVSSFFAASSRFGTPEELKLLIDEAHRLGLRVIMDLVHSHAVKNEIEGLSCFDGSEYQYFHAGGRGMHDAWDSRCFDYGKPQVLHFLLSNCRYWLDEFHLDGFRFDGVTSMLYRHHGFGPAFTSYDQYFDDQVDLDAFAYLALANQVIHMIAPHAITIAEDVSGMPGLAAAVDEGGCGFDYRLAMGVPDCWFKLANDVRDEDWNMHYLWHELTNRRQEEKTISYVESHDQSLVGGKTMIFELIDAPMYTAMRTSDHDLAVERGLALHMMMRLATLATAGHGYLNFMGNEFGHPEWIDFPREGNNWSYQFARRQWSLRDNPELRYHGLAEFDQAMLYLAAKHNLLQQALGRPFMLEEETKLLIFPRGELFFCFNFHPSISRPGLPVEVPPGRYRHRLDTDQAQFGMQQRICPDQEYTPQPEQYGNQMKHILRMYLPARCAMVLERIPPGRNIAPRDAGSPA